MLDAALSYLARGWHVIPGNAVGPGGLCDCGRADCDRPGKHPRVKWTEFQHRIPTEVEVRGWWRSWPRANPLVVCAPGLVVIDLDPRHGGDESWHGLLAGRTLPPTPTDTTGGGGQHLFFARPEQDIPSSVGLLPGIDVRGNAPGHVGYVLAPPSTHFSGGTYEWDSDAHIDDVEPAAMPDWLVAFCKGRPAPRSGQPGKPGAALASSSTTPQVVIEGLVRVGEGERNNMMTRVAGFFARGGTPAADVLTSCEWVNEQQFDPPLAAFELGRLVSSVVGREAAGIAAGVGAVEAGPLPEDMEGAAVVAWLALGVRDIAGWHVLLGDTTEYVLTVGVTEVRLGSDLLDLDFVRAALLTNLRVLLPTRKLIGDWPMICKGLRDCATERVVDPVNAEEKLEEWLDAYVARYGGRNQTLERSEWAAAIEQAPILVGEVLHLRPARFSRFIESVFGERIKTDDLRHLLSNAKWVAGLLDDGEKGIKTWRK